MAIVLALFVLFGVAAIVADEAAVGVVTLVIAGAWCAGGSALLKKLSSWQWVRYTYRT